MDLIPQKLSVSELTGRILQMAQTGVYRESIFEAFQPVATKREIRSAIAQAKQFGLRSVAAMRDTDLGTYYQADPAQYPVFQAALKAAILPENEETLAQRMIRLTQAIQAMLVLAGGSALALMVVGSLCLLNHQPHTGGLLWLGSFLLGSLWGLQCCIARPTLMK